MSAGLDPHLRQQRGDSRYSDMGVVAEEVLDVRGVLPLAKFLDEGMCVPRDMGAMSADAIKRLIVHVDQ